MAGNLIEGISRSAPIAAQHVILLVFDITLLASLSEQIIWDGQRSFFLLPAFFAGIAFVGIQHERQILQLYGSRFLSSRLYPSDLL